MQQRIFSILESQLDLKEASEEELKTALEQDKEEDHNNSGEKRQQEAGKEQKKDAVGGKTVINKTTNTYLNKQPDVFIMNDADLSERIQHAMQQDFFLGADELDELVLNFLSDNGLMAHPDRLLLDSQTETKQQQQQQQQQQQVNVALVNEINELKSKIQSIREENNLLLRYQAQKISPIKRAPKESLDDLTKHAKNILKRLNHHHDEDENNQAEDAARKFAMFNNNNTYSISVMRLVSNNVELKRENENLKLDLEIIKNLLVSYFGDAHEDRADLREETANVLRKMFKIESKPTRKKTHQQQLISSDFASALNQFIEEEVKNIY